jgi:hypothetical protein
VTGTGTGLSKASCYRDCQPQCGVFPSLCFKFIIQCPSVCRVFIFKVTVPSPLRANSACAKRAAYPDPPPVVSCLGPRIPCCPLGLFRGFIARIAQVWLRPELFPGIKVLPGPATGSHIVNRGTPVASLGQPQLNVPEKKSHPWEAPAAQISQRAPSPQGRGRLTSS